MGKNRTQRRRAKFNPEAWQPRCAAQFNPPLCLKPPFPNPAADHATLEWTIDDTLLIEFSVSHMPDSTIAVLLKEVLSPGDYRLIWDVRDKSGIVLPDGIYRISIKALKNSIIQTETFGDIQVAR